MRKIFANELVRQAKKNDSIWLVTADLGYGLFDEFKIMFPDRYLNTGASEQAASDICVGLALSGKIPFFYSISSFLLYRCFETWRNYLHYEKIPVKLVGSGRDKEYGGLGLTHWAHDDKVTMAMFSNIKSYWPEKGEVEGLVRKAVKDKSPYYINLSKL